VQVRWANVQVVNVKFSQDLTHQKSLKSVTFDRVIGKIKRWTFLGHIVEEPWSSTPVISVL